MYINAQGQNLDGNPGNVIPVPTAGEVAETCGGEPPNEIVPEPMTMSLVALGLVMMGGAGLVRRRRKV